MKITEKLPAILEKLRSRTKLAQILRQTVFINIALLTGFFLALMIFFPQSFILSKINQALFIHDMGLEADSISYSPVASISVDNAVLSQKGEQRLTVEELDFSPALFSIMGGTVAGELSLEGFNNRGGTLYADFSMGEHAFYKAHFENISLSLLQIFFEKIFLKGDLNSTIDISKEKKGYNGTISINGSEVVFRGEIETPMGPFQIDKITLGTIELDGIVKNNRLELKKFTLKGAFDINATGKITLNNRTLKHSRMDLDVSIEIKDRKELKQLEILESMPQVSRYKDRKTNAYNLKLRGSLSNPILRKARNRSGRRTSPTRRNRNNTTIKRGKK